MKGAKFNIFVHATGSDFGGLQIDKEGTVGDTWNTFEGGKSYISGSVIANNMLSSLGIDRLTYDYEFKASYLGFSDIPPELVIGMGPDDIFASHENSKLLTSFNKQQSKEGSDAEMQIKFHSPESLMEQTKQNVQGGNKRQRNEVTISRRYVEEGALVDESHKGRVNPDYIIAYGEATPEDIALAQKFAKNGKPIPVIEIDIKRYLELYPDALPKEVIDGLPERFKPKLVIQEREVNVEPEAKIGDSLSFITESEVKSAGKDGIKKFQELGE